MAFREMNWKKMLMVLICKLKRIDFCSALNVNTAKQMNISTNFYNCQFRLACVENVCMSMIPLKKLDGIWSINVSELVWSWAHKPTQKPNCNWTHRLLELQKKCEEEIYMMMNLDIWDLPQSHVLLWRRRCRFAVKYQMCTSTPVFNCYGFALLVDIEINLQFKIIIGDFWCIIPEKEVGWAECKWQSVLLIIVFLKLKLNCGSLVITGIYWNFGWFRSEKLIWVKGFIRLCMTVMYLHPSWKFKTTSAHPTNSTNLKSFSPLIPPSK